MEPEIETRKSLCVMYGQSSTAQPQAFLRGRRLAAIAWAAAVLAVFMMLVPGAAEACSKRHVSGGITRSVNIAHKTTHVAQVTAVSVSTIGVATRDVHCCGIGGHCGGLVYASGCCAVCSTAIDIMSAGIEPPDTPGSHDLSIQGKIVSPTPPPVFRPPRLFA